MTLRIIKKVKRIPIAIKAGWLWYKCIDSRDKHLWENLRYYLNRYTGIDDSVETRVLLGLALVMLGEDTDALQELEVAWQKLNTEKAESEYSPSDYDYLLAYLNLLISIANNSDDSVELSDFLLECRNKGDTSERMMEFFTVPQELSQRIDI